MKKLMIALRNFANSQKHCNSTISSTIQSVYEHLVNSRNVQGGKETDFDNNNTLWLNECHSFRVTAAVSVLEIRPRSIPGSKFPVSRRMHLVSKLQKDDRIC